MAYNTYRADLLEAFGADELTSAEMRKAIDEWFRLYYQTEPTADEDPSQRLPVTIVKRLTDAVFAEYSTTAADPSVQKVLDNIQALSRKIMQTCMIGGEVLVKVDVVEDGYSFTPIRRDRFMVFGRDVNGRPSDVGTISRSSVGSWYYTLTERRTVDTRGRLRIVTKLYQSRVEGQLGRRVPLRTLSQYEDIPDEYIFPEPVGGLLMGWMRVPEENCVDGGEDGCSVFAPAVGLIHQINHNERLISQEFDLSRKRVFAPDDVLRTRDVGTGRVKELRDDLFVRLDSDPDEGGITVFSPEIRYQPYHERKREYLRNVESICELQRGLLYDVDAAERTATEILDSKGGYALTLRALQDAWTSLLLDLVGVCLTLGRLYHIPGTPSEIIPDSISIDFGNGVLYDEDKEWNALLDLHARGLLAPEYLLGWHFGDPSDTPADRQRIREKYMPTISDLDAE